MYSLSALPSVDAGNAYWALPADRLFSELRTAPDGLSSAEASARLRSDGPNAIGRKGEISAISVFARQFRSPLVLILVFAAIVSAFVGEGSEAAIIAIIVLASCVLSFTQEYGASKAMQVLTARISRKARVLRDGVEKFVRPRRSWPATWSGYRPATSSPPKTCC